jgi:hypothetical protein
MAKLPRFNNSFRILGAPEPERSGAAPSATKPGISGSIPGGIPIVSEAISDFRIPNGNCNFAKALQNPRIPAPRRTVASFGGWVYIIGSPAGQN